MHVDSPTDVTATKGHQIPAQPQVRELEWAFFDKYTLVFLGQW